MTKKLLFLLLAALLMLTVTASAAVSLPPSTEKIGDSAFEGDRSLTGRVVLPNSVKTVGSRAFAETGLHALVVPSSCTSVGGGVLTGSGAAYLYLNGSTTALGSTASGAVYVFGPATGSASTLSNFYAADTLVNQGGFYYSVTDGTAIPLCAVTSSSVSGQVKIPKLVNGQPVRSLSTLVANGCDQLTLLQIPAYLAAPGDFTSATYESMTAQAPTASAQSASVGETITWTTALTGDYGDVTYEWYFDTDGATQSIMTSEPTVDFTCKTAGSCVVTVTAMDELGDVASAVSEAITITDTVTAPDTDAVYRALLVGNTYPGQSLALLGCDNDKDGMYNMLSRMTATPYSVTRKSDLTVAEIITAIRTTFADATANDVSLFFYAGHGANHAGTSYHGALVGDDGEYLKIAELKAVLDEIPGKKIVILDSCHSGAMISRSADSTGVTKSELNAFNSQVVAAFSAQTRSTNNLANSGYYVITAAHSSEECKTTGYDADGDGIVDRHFGIFTYFMCMGSGWNIATNTTTSLGADSDSDQQITLYEAYSYARYKALNANPDQTAQCYPSNSSMVIWAK